jgi:ABC-2 type transport system ATP-binding protein
MTNRPHVFQLRSSDNRRLAAVLIGDPSVAGVELDDGALTVRAADFGEFTHVLPRLAKTHEIRLREVLNTDESLDSVFSYLVAQ